MSYESLLLELSTLIPIFSLPVYPAFTVLESTGEIVREERKARLLMTGGNDPTLESAKNQILATPTLRATFENASNFSKGSWCWKP